MLVRTRRAWNMSVHSRYTLASLSLYVVQNTLFWGQAGPFVLYEVIAECGEYLAPHAKGKKCFAFT